MAGASLLSASGASLATIGGVDLGSDGYDLAASHARYFVAGPLQGIFVNALNETQTVHFRTQTPDPRYPQAAFVGNKALTILSAGTPKHRSLWLQTVDTQGTVYDAIPVVGDTSPFEANEFDLVPSGTKGLVVWLGAADEVFSKLVTP